MRVQRHQRQALPSDAQQASANGHARYPTLLHIPCQELRALCAAGERQWERPIDSTPALSGPFVPSAGFVGARAGYAFKMGPKGLGYYLDGPASTSAPGAPEPVPGPYLCLEWLWTARG